MTILIPNGEQTFVDQNGDPISGGSVYSYVRGTTNPIPTYVDEGLTVQNPNPVILDQAGRAIMWRAGLSRQVVYDMFGNLLWDRDTGFVLGSEDFPPDLTIPSNVTFDGTSTFNGPTNINGSLTVTGFTNLEGGANITGGLTVDNINATNSLTVNGTTNLNGTTNITGTVTGTFTMPDDIFVHNISPSAGNLMPNFTAGANFQSNPNVGPNDAIQSFGNIDIFQPGRYVRITGATEPTLALVDLLSGVAWGITVSGTAPGNATIDFGFVDAQAAQIRNIMVIDIAGDVETTGNLQVDGNLTVIGTINGQAFPAAQTATDASITTRLDALDAAVRALGGTV